MQTLLGAGAALALPGRSHASVPAAKTLSGNQLQLAIGTSQVNYTGKTRPATTVNGTLPAPILRLKEGQPLAINVRNQLDVPSSIHWHGLLLPFQMDGVPGISFPGIAAHSSFTYRFPVRQSGTYWYHSHSGFQEQTGLYGAIVIEPEGGERFPTERDYVVLLSDWSDESPDTIFRHLLKQGDYYNYQEPTLLELLRDIRHDGFEAALAKREMWNRMRMSPSDLADVSGHTYTYLMNGNSPSGNWTGLFNAGEKVRLRLINGSAMSYFDFRIPDLELQVVAADGQDVEPVSVDELRLAPAETYDVIVRPSADRAWTLFAQSIDRTGFAAGTLTPHPDLTAPFPAMDAPQRLTMTDMMGAMSHSGISHSGMSHANSNMHNMPDMAGMEMGGMEMDMSGMDMHAMHHMNPQPEQAHQGHTIPETAALPHPASEANNPGVDMQVDQPRTNLDDPGTGLRDNGRRVLTYADLHSLGISRDTREPGREIQLHLTGNMQRYTWSFNGIPSQKAAPLEFRHGEKLRLTLVNDTMMNHPIHLHGMWSDLVAPDGNFQVRKHTVNVQPAQQVSYDVSADALGRWAFHCHLLYHMHAGMFREVRVS